MACPKYICVTYRNLGFLFKFEIMGKSIMLTNQSAITVIISISMIISQTLHNDLILNKFNVYYRMYS